MEITYYHSECVYALSCNGWIVNLRLFARAVQLLNIDLSSKKLLS